MGAWLKFRHNAPTNEPLETRTASPEHSRSRAGACLSEPAAQVQDKRYIRNVRSMYNERLRMLQEDYTMQVDRLLRSGHTQEDIAPMREVIDIMVENLKSTAEGHRQIAVEAAKAKVKEDFIARSRKFIDTIVAAQQNTNMEPHVRKRVSQGFVAPCREIVRALQNSSRERCTCHVAVHLAISQHTRKRAGSCCGMRSIAIEACQMTIDEAKSWLGAAIDLNTTLLRVHIHASKHC